MVTNSVSLGNLSGGVEVVAKLQLSALRDTGSTCDLLALNRTVDYDTSLLMDRITLPKARKILWVKQSGGFSFKLIRIFLKIFKSYDVIHIHLCKDFVTTLALLICRLNKKKHVIQTHGMFLREDRKADQFFNWLCMKLSKKADTHLVLTNSEEEWFQERGWQAKRLKIRNPIKIPIVSKMVNLNLFDVCYLSRFHLRKRPKMVIEAIQILTAKGYNLKIRMAGSDEGELTHCNSMINAYSLGNNFDISGQISSDEILCVLNSSKVMVLPSYSEFVPMIILESLSHGVPVIAGSDCELAQELNKNGICLLADEPSVLAHGIATLLEDDLLRKNLAMAGVAWVKENCDPIGVANKLLAIYSKSDFTQ